MPHDLPNSLSMWMLVSLQVFEQSLENRPSHKTLLRVPSGLLPHTKDCIRGHVKIPRRRLRSLQLVVLAQCMVHRPIDNSLMWIVVGTAKRVCTGTVPDPTLCVLDRVIVAGHSRLVGAL